MRGGRDPLTKLFILGINENETKEKKLKPSPIIEQFSENSVYECSSKQNLAIFLHQACFSPPISTWIEAIKKNFFATFPGLTVDLVNKYTPKSEHIVKGHTRQTFKNKISTKLQENPPQSHQRILVKTIKKNQVKHQAITKKKQRPYSN